MVKGYRLTAESTNSGKTQSFFIRTVSKSEAKKEAKKEFKKSFGRDYKVVSVEESE